MQKIIILTVLLVASIGTIGFMSDSAFVVDIIRKSALVLRDLSDMF